MQGGGGPGFSPQIKIRKNTISIMNYYKIFIDHMKFADYIAFLVITFIHKLLVTFL
jgi:hypothetical protein